MPAREGHNTCKAVGDGSHEAGHGGSAEQWGRVQPCREKNIVRSLGLGLALPTRPWASGGLSPEAGAMGVAGSPLRLTAPICWMWQGEKATPGLR